MTLPSSRIAWARCTRLFRLLSVSAAVSLVSTTTYAQHRPTPADPAPDPVEALQNLSRGPVYIIPGKSEISTLYFDGSQIEIQTEQRWRFMCGSDLTGLTLEDLRWSAQSHIAAFEDGPAVIVDSGTRTGSINIVCNADGSVPSGALSGLAMAETYLEGLFSDSITVTINCSFASLGGGVLGTCGSSYVVNVTYNNSRNGLQSGMDGDDVIQSWLPAGNTVPVRYDGGSHTITNENLIDWAKANYHATVGTVTGNAAGMQFNDQVSWDYDPSNGVSFTRYSFVDIAIHETGHALGFVSAADDVGNSMKALDLFRFQRTDDNYDYNPDTYAEFQTTPRLVDYNLPNDQHNSDLIDYTYRMSDGSPYQASHFREQSSPWIGLMDPAIANGEHHYPDFYSAADKNMFDAIGYHYPACDAPQFTTQPEPTQTICRGHQFSLSVAVDIASPAYQWRKFTANLVDDGVHIFGATTDTLTVVGATDADASTTYNCLVINTVDGCPGFSDNAEIVIDEYSPDITGHPQDLEVDEGGWAFFSVTVENAVYMEYQWRKDGLPLSEGGRFSGTTSQIMFINPVELGDAGQYDCLVTSQLGTLCSTASDPATLTVNPVGCPNPGTSGGYCTADVYPNNGDGVWNYPDEDGDCVISLGDLSQLLANYGVTTGATREHGDIYPQGGDGQVDLSDLSELLSQYGDNCN